MKTMNRISQFLSRGDCLATPCKIRRPNPRPGLGKWPALLMAIAAALGLAASPAAVAQELINVDVVTTSTAHGATGGQLPVYNGQGVLGGAADTTWNAYYDTNSSLSGLLDSTGNATGVGMTLSGGGFWSDATGGNIPTSGDLSDLLGDYYEVGGALLTVTLTGLDPNSTYEVVSYSVGDQNGQGGVCGGMLSGTSTGSTRASLLLNSNYVDNVPIAPNSAGEIVYTISPHGGYSIFNALQIQKLAPDLMTPVITGEPTNEVVLQGQTAAFSVSVNAGSEFPYYQWYVRPPV